ncbi:ABC-three component system middle component 6 [Marinicrinis sediminis]|uniref:ABC-three component system middle component 6 n=1 Tax=Marinicrinis sediminis TaxID=1652465 RepID=A0ABW5R8G9_9BACL
MIFVIINVDREPKFSLYYIGAVILEELKLNGNMLTIDYLFEIIRSKVDRNLHVDFLYYSLDWLFLLSLIRLEEDRVVLC